MNFDFYLCKKLTFRISDHRHHQHHRHEDLLAGRGLLLAGLAKEKQFEFQKQNRSGKERKWKQRNNILTLEKEKAIHSHSGNSINEDKIEEKKDKKFFTSMASLAICFADLA